MRSKHSSSPFIRWNPSSEQPLYHPSLGRAKSVPRGDQIIGYGLLIPVRQEGTHAKAQRRQGLMPQTSSRLCALA